MGGPKWKIFKTQIYNLWGKYLYMLFTKFHHSCFNFFAKKEQTQFPGSSNCFEINFQRKVQYWKLSMAFSERSEMFKNDQRHSCSDLRFQQQISQNFSNDSFETAYYCRYIDDLNSLWRFICRYLKMPVNEAWLKTLQDMGFAENRSKRALKATDNKVRTYLNIRIRPSN